MRNLAINFRIKSILKSFVEQYIIGLNDFTFKIVRCNSLTVLNITIYNVQHFPIIYKVVFIDNETLEIEL